VTIGVLTAVTDAVAESALTAALAGNRDDVTLVRRCVDLAEVVAVAATGNVQVAVISADLRRLDRASVATLASAGVHLLLLADVGPSAVRARQLGAELVLPPDAPAAVIIDAIRQLGIEAPRIAHDASPEHAGTAAVVMPGEAEALTGQIIAVWGPTGAPGRTTVALNLAAEVAGRGLPVLLVDADPSGGTVAQLVGMTQDVPGLIGASMAANNGLLDRDRLASFARDLGPDTQLRVLTGVPRPDRWTELRPAGLESVLSVARELAAVTIVDCGFSLDGGPAGMFDASGPGVVTRTVLASADIVIAVGSADPCGLVRLTQGLALLADVTGVAPLIVANRVRSGALPSGGVAEVRVALQTRCGHDPAALIPYARADLDRAAATGRLLIETAPDCEAVKAVAGLADLLVGPAIGGIRGRRGRPRGKFRRSSRPVVGMTARTPEMSGQQE
jgi:MinD-like ATPase involved in chromosome partitioning or flagellar assembly